MAALASRTDRLAVLPHVTRALDDLRGAGLGPLVDDLAARRVAACAEVDLVWWASLAQEISIRDPGYGAHDGEGLWHAVEEFVAADHAHLDATVHRVREAVARNIREVLGDTRRRRHWSGPRPGGHDATSPCETSCRRPAALTAIKPCWAMSPLVVASTLPPGRWFDVVIFDEASQVQPAQAISAISRGRQVVVAGDERQLPRRTSSQWCPTTRLRRRRTRAAFSPRASSRCSMCYAAALPTRRLTWHYRSRDERLIAFSNATMYDGGLTTFPGTAIDSAVTFEPVEGHAVVQPGEQTIESTSAEVDRVVSLVLDHARRRPHESLGVIALGIKHANLLDDAITAALRARPTSQTSSTRIATSASSSRTSSGYRATNATPSSCRSDTARRPTAGSCTASDRSTSRAASGDSTWPSRGPGAG